MTATVKSFRETFHAIATVAPRQRAQSRCRPNRFTTTSNDGDRS